MEKQNTNRIEIIEVEDPDFIGLHDRKNGKFYSFNRNYSEMTNKRQACNKQVTTTQQTSNNETINKLMLHFGEKVNNLSQYCQRNSANPETLFKVLQLKNELEVAKSCNDIAKARMIVKQLQNTKNAIMKAHKSRELKKKFDKKEHYQNNILTIYLLTNKKFIVNATNKKYRNFKQLPKYIPSPIVNEINKMGHSQMNGKPHTVRTVSYLADLHREYIELKKIKTKKKRKIFAVLILIITFSIMTYIRVATNKPLLLNATLLQSFEVAKIWKYNEIIAKVQLYETAENVFISDWRIEKVLETTENFKMTETELIFKIDSVVNYKY